MADSRFKEVSQEGFGVIHPVDNICCIGCIFVNAGDPLGNEPHKGYCEIYSHDEGKSKPNSVLFDGSNCKYRREK